MKSLLYIGNKLSRHGSNATAIETLGPLLERQGFTMRYASSQKNKALRLADMVWTTLRFARSSDYVLIDTYSTSNFWYAFAVSQLCRLLKTRYIPILHGGELPKRLAHDPRLCRLVFGHAYVNVAPSDYLLKAFEHVGFKRLKSIPNAIPVDDYPFRLRTNLEPKLLWVRSLASIYNPKMALRVLFEVKRHFPLAKLCMVGPEKDVSVEKLQQMANGLGISVHFTGRLSKSEWIELSAQYDIFINTTHKDNMPVSVIEAMALGLPVVSTDVGGLTFLIKDGQNGLVVPDGDHQKMANCVVDLLNNPQMATKIVQNAHALTRAFDEKQIAVQWLEILK